MTKESHVRNSTGAFAKLNDSYGIRALDLLQKFQLAADVPGDFALADYCPLNLMARLVVTDGASHCILELRAAMIA